MDSSEAVLTLSCQEHLPSTSGLELLHQALQLVNGDAATFSTMWKLPGTCWQVALLLGPAGCFVFPPSPLVGKPSSL